MSDRVESDRVERRPGGWTPRASRQADKPARPYGIERHRHLFAAWAAGRAASVAGCRFKVEQGLDILVSCGFDEDFTTPERLPAPAKTDVCHRAWRRLVVRQAARHNLTFTHGVAAKLINCYLKSRFVCGGYHAHARVKSLHPPIDDVMLRTLARQDIGGYRKEWLHARAARWSKLDSKSYERLIQLIRLCLKGEPLWMIEQYWQGHR